MRSALWLPAIVLAIALLILVASFGAIFAIDPAIVDLPTATSRPG
jgi:hypothetical protein